MMASSSQLSQSRPHDVDGVGRLGPHLGRRAPPPCGRSGRRRRRWSDTATFQPARPVLTQSRVATFLDTWNGSVWVVVTTGTSPIDCVTGATRARASRASRPPRTRPGRRPGPSRVSSRVTKSNPPRSASCTSRTRRSAREQAGGVGVGLPPRRRVAAGAVEGDAEVERAYCRHGCPPLAMLRMLRVHARRRFPRNPTGPVGNHGRW